MLENGSEPLITQIVTTMANLFTVEVVTTGPELLITQVVTTMSDLFTVEAVTTWIRTVNYSSGNT